MRTVWVGSAISALAKRLLLFVSLVTYISFNTTFSQILLPVEVLGEEGLIVDRTFELTSAQASNANGMWMQVNNLSYENKASIRVNGGTWIDLNHETVDMYVPERQRGGMVHGGYNTIRFTLPVSGFTAGSNTVSFRFNVSDAISIGYRVVKFNVIDPNESFLIPDDQFVEDDPELWTAPEGFEDAASIAEGEELWREGQLWNHYLPGGRTGFWYNYELRGAMPINATCADCHTQDGRDLELFAYSNESIIERAKFHQLTEEEGKKITAYIRSLSSTHENVNRNGRPWNPPYQPGPEISEREIDYWHAGAGLDAVLENDSDMLPYMFPDGVDSASVATYFDQDLPDVDRTTMPLPIQLPDWKHWLPMIHPKDAFTKGTYYQESYDNWTKRSKGPFDDAARLNPERGYEKYREYLESLPKKGDGVTIDLGSLSQAEIDELREEAIIFRFNFRWWLGQGGSGGSHWRINNGKGYDALSDDVGLTFANTSNGRLQAVKNFEIMQEFNMQDQAPDYLNPVDFPTRRQWMGWVKNVWELPAHITGCQDNGGCNNFDGQPKATGQFESTSWYQLQFILSGGEGTNTSQNPIDYNYHHPFILLSSSSSGIDNVLRYYMALANVYKIKSWSGGTDISTGEAFLIRNQVTSLFLGKLGDNPGKQSFKGHPEDYWVSRLDEIYPGMTKWVLDALFNEFLKSVNQFDLDTWPRGNASFALDPIEKDKVVNVVNFQAEDSTQTGEQDELTDAWWADHIYWSIQKAGQFGVDCDLIDRMIDWGQRAWPNIDWEPLRNQAAASITLVLEEDCSTGNYTVSADTDYGGEDADFQWYVNDLLQSFSGSEFESAGLAPGDRVRCSMVSSASCVDNSSAEAELVIPLTQVSIQSQLNEEGWAEVTDYSVCTGDSISLRINQTAAPILWLDAMDLSETLSDGAEVDEWLDRSEGARTIEALDNSNFLTPVFHSSGLRGLPTVLFGMDRDGNLLGQGAAFRLFDASEDDFLDDGDWTMLYVGEYGNLRRTDLVGNKGNQDNGLVFGIENNRFRASLGAEAFTFAEDKVDDGSNSNDNGFDLNVTSVRKQDLNFQFASNGILEIDTEVQGTLQSGAATFLGVARVSGGAITRYYQGSISEFIVFDYALSDEEIEYWEGYLAHKWNMATEIDDDYHPYRTFSPLAYQVVTPSGNELQLDESDPMASITLASAEAFGEYTVYRSSSSCTSAQTFTVIDAGELSSAELLSYSVDDEAFENGSEVTVSVGRTLELRFNFSSGFDYQWQSPSGEIFINEDPVVTANETEHNGTWTMTVAQDADRCLDEDLVEFFDVTVVNHIITFPDDLSSLMYGDAPVTLTATSSEGLPVTYEYEGPIRVDGNTMTIIGAGAASVTARQDGAGDVPGASPITITFTIIKASLTAVADNKEIIFGGALPEYTISYNGFVNADDVSVLDEIPVANSTAVPTSAAGTYTISITGGADDNYSITTVDGTLTILPVSTLMAPGNLTLTNNGDLSITLQWVDNTDDEAGFYIEVSEDEGGNFNSLAEVLANITSYTHTSLDEGQEYCYQVQAFNDLLNSEFTNIACLQLIEPLVVSNQMTLNGDGVNDVWQVEEFSDMESSTFKIFNKQGNMVFNSVGYDQPWEGTYNGSIVPEGVYYYIIKGPSRNESGYILVTR